MLDTVKNLLDRHVFLKDVVSKSDVLKLSERDVLTNYLPYLSYSKMMKSDESDEEVVSHAFLNFDNTIGWIWELVPPPFIGPDKLDTLHGIIRTSFPKGTVMQWILFPDDNLTPFIEEYTNLRDQSDPINYMTIEQMQKYLCEGTKGVSKMANIPIRNYRLFLTLKSEQRIPEDTLVSVEQGLSMAGFAPRRWEANDLLAWLAQFFNGEVSHPEYTPHRYLREQFRSNNPAVRDESSDSIEKHRPLDDFSTYPSRFGNRYVNCLYPNEVPQKKNDPLRTNELLGGFMGVMDDMNQIKYPHLYTLTIVYDDLKSEIGSKATQTMFQKVGAGLAHALNARINEFSRMQSIMANGGNFAYMIPQLMVFGDTPAEVRSATAQAIKLWDAKDFTLMKETKLAQTMFIHGLPFGLYHIDQNLINIDRYYYLDYENITRFLPVQSDFRGGGDPVQVYQGRKGQIVTLNMFDKRANAHNFYVVAETGGGKSFTLNDLVDSYASTGAKVRIADLGESYKKLTHMRKGRFIDFGVVKPICMNPLDFIALDEEDFAQNISMAQIVFGSCAYSYTGKAIDEVEANLINQACVMAHRKGDQMRGTDFIIEFLKSRSYQKDDETDFPEVDLKARNLAYLLHNFGSGGAFEKFMVGPSQFNIKDDEFVCADIEKLRSVKQLFFPMVMQLMNCITQDLYLSDRSRPSIILFEEIASMVKQVGNISMDGFASMVEEGYRRARKYRGAFGIVLQSALDLATLPGLGDVAKANAQWRYYLESKMYTEAAGLQALPGITSGFPLKLINSVKNVRPRYGEMFIDSPLGMGVARLCVDPWRYWVNTSDGKDVAAYNKLVNAGMEPVEALSRLSNIEIPDHIRKQLNAAKGDVHEFPAA
ncbi:conjugal transfer protein TraC [Erwinia psidii]|uniref:TraC family protein n=1 Tax=Erwinia psidii TaxID=69224 RepID=UPI00226B68FC|nr:TraC family protein [Erwinia psidii]MCX8959385.1 conjugal transfer protein TraC [Erwinia psidii]MCX8962974.1 conjugal transfer protein TraC [Erwinia psidii]